MFWSHKFLIVLIFCKDNHIYEIFEIFLHKIILFYIVFNIFAFERVITFINYPHLPTI